MAVDDPGPGARGCIRCHPGFSRVYARRSTRRSHRRRAKRRLVCATKAICKSINACSAQAGRRAFCRRWKALGSGRRKVECVDIALQRAVGEVFMRELVQSQGLLRSR